MSGRCRKGSSRAIPRGRLACSGPIGDMSVVASTSVTISPETFLAIIGASAVAGAIAATVRFDGLGFPVVVIELLLGVLIGPQVLGLEVTPFVNFFSSLGLGMLFFFAGYEIDFGRINGLPLRLGMIGWAMSLAIGYALGALLATAGIVLSLLYTGSALDHGDRDADPDPVRRGRSSEPGWARICSPRARSASLVRSCC